MTSTGCATIFPGLEREKAGRPVAFLDNPAGTQIARSVVQRMTDVMLHQNSNLGGFFDTSIEAMEAVAAAHRAAEIFVNARHPGEVFFGQSMTNLAGCFLAFGRPFPRP